MQAFEALTPAFTWPQWLSSSCVLTGGEWCAADARMHALTGRLLTIRNQGRRRLGSQPGPRDRAVVMAYRYAASSAAVYWRFAVLPFQSENTLAVCAADAYGRRPEARSGCMSSAFVRFAVGHPSTKSPTKGGPDCWLFFSTLYGAARPETLRSPIVRWWGSHARVILASGFRRGANRVEIFGSRLARRDASGFATWPLKCRSPLIRGMPSRRPRRGQPLSARHHPPAGALTMSGGQLGKWH